MKLNNLFTDENHTIKGGLSSVNTKYEIIKDSIEYFSGTAYYRIRALRDIRPEVSKGDIGGYLQCSDNPGDILSITDSCWVGGDARVTSLSHITDDALVTDTAFVDNQILSGNTKIFDSTQIKGYWWILNSPNTVNADLSFQDIQGLALTNCPKIKDLQNLSMTKLIVNQDLSFKYIPNNLINIKFNKIYKFLHLPYLARQPINFEFSIFKPWMQVLYDIIPAPKGASEQEKYKAMLAFQDELIFSNLFSKAAYTI